MDTSSGGLAVQDVGVEATACPDCAAALVVWWAAAFDLRMREVSVRRSRCAACGWDHTAAYGVRRAHGPRTSPPAGR